MVADSVCAKINDVKGCRRYPIGWRYILRWQRPTPMMDSDVVERSILSVGWVLRESSSKRVCCYGCSVAKPLQCIQPLLQCTQQRLYTLSTCSAC